MPFAYSNPEIQDHYLVHYGIKGQKWGIRRFQNEDGSLTAEGRKRYGDSSGFGDKMKKAGKAVGDGTKKLAGKVGKAIDNKLDARKPSRMTDQELRERLNRLQMEKQYIQIKRELQSMNHPKKQKKEHSFLKKAMNDVFISSALTVAGSIVKRGLQVASDDYLAPKRAEWSAKRPGADEIYKKYRYFDKQEKKK